MFYIKSPAPFFRHPPQRAHQHCPRHCHAGSRKGERGCVYIALYHEEETPPLFFRYPLTPYHPGSTSGPLTPSR